MWMLCESSDYKNNFVHLLELPLGCTVPGTLHYINSFDYQKPFVEGTVVISICGN